MIIGLDAGYGYTKMVTFDGSNIQKLMFPSYVSRYVPRRTFNDSFEVTTVNGRQYVVGEDVEGTRRVGFDFLDTDEYLAIVGCALSRVSGLKRAVILGLPPQSYNKERAAYLTERVRSMEVTIESGVTAYSPQVINYIPQGAGIFFSHRVNGGDKDHEKTVVVVDMGYHTMDVVTFAGGAYKGGLSRTYPLGARKLYDLVRDAYIKKYSSFLPAERDNLVEKLLKDGKVFHLGQVRAIDVESIVNDFYGNQIMHTLADYVSEIEEHDISPEKIVLGGGGVTHLGAVSGATVVMDPQFANARGYLEYGLNLKL